MAQERFSKRFGLAQKAKEPEITIRDDAPSHNRDGILSTAKGPIGLSPSFIRDALCIVLRKIPDRNNWSEYPNIWEECQILIEDCPWYNVYDFVEAIYENILFGDPGKAAHWERLINEYFIEAGVGWRLIQGRLESRGPESFKTAVDTARESLKAAKLPTARSEIDEALRDLSRRPEPDLTGAIHHAMGALECTARVYAGDPKATLGDILKIPNIVPKPLDKALSQMWGYASEKARHIREDQTPEYAEAQMVVGVAAVVCTYLTAKIKKP